MSEAEAVHVAGAASAAPRLELPGALGEATSLAAILDFDAPHPRHFGAPAASSAPFVVGGFNGEVLRGASCNCRSVTLVPHCNGTHTESVAHLTREPLSPLEVTPLHPLPALLVDVRPVACEGTGETADPPPQPGDRVVTAAAIEAAWRTAASRGPQLRPRVLVVRTGAHEDGAQPAPYLTLDAAQLLVERGVEHLVLELPSMDRGEDQGRLGAHRVFFGLPPGSTRLAEAGRAHCTITELARVPHTLPPGPCAVQLQLTAWAGDAVPSRPIHFGLEPAPHRGTSA